MKKNILLYTLSAILLAACSDDTAVTKETGESSDVVAMLPDFVPYHIEDPDDTPEARSSIHWNVVGGVTSVTFHWDDKDKLAVYSSTPDNNSRMMFELQEIDQDAKKADFTSKDFKLTDGKSYYAFSPYAAISDFQEDNKNAIHVAYAQQNQKENKSTAHLGAYDYLAACTQVTDNVGTFKFKRLGAVLRFRVGFNELAEDQTVTIKKFELARQDNIEIPYERDVSLTASSKLDDDYKPTITFGHEPNPYFDKRQSFVLNLGEYDEQTKDYKGITVPKYKNNAANLLVMFLMLPATDELKDVPLYGILTDTDNNEYYIPFTGFEFVGGTYNNYAKINPTKAQQLEIKLSVAKDWQVGHTVSRGTSTGDPGVTDALTRPNYINVYVCKDGVYQEGKTIDATDDSKWEESSDKKEWIYKDIIKITSIGDAPTTDLHAYIVASKEDFTPLQVPTINTTAEADIKAMTFDIPSSADDDTKKQDYLKNIYSTDYRILKGEVPYINATAYHTAAIMDVQWNATTALSGNVSVNNLPTTGISLFGPTTSATDSWTPTTGITTGSQWNGRETFYVPNLSTATYSITTGSHTDNITFPTPSAADKGAPWLKANIKLP